MPYLAYRITGLLGRGPGEPLGTRPVPWAMLGRLYYDTALAPVRPAMTSLLEPIMIVFLAVVVGSIVIAMFLPLIDLMNSLSGSGGGKGDE